MSKFRQCAIYLSAIASLAVSANSSADMAAKSADAVMPVQIGQVAPDFEVRTATGETYTFDADGQSAKTMLIFYRGGWCPYCNRHLQSLQSVVPKLRDAGIDVLFLSADRPEILFESLEEPGVDYTLLSDASMSASRAYGLAFVVDDKTVARYKEYGIDLEASSGYDHHQLPVPAVYLIDDGKVAFMYADADYKKRLAPEKILEAAGIDG